MMMMKIDTKLETLNLKQTKNSIFFRFSNYSSVHEI